MAIDYQWRYPLYSDFIDEFIPLPKWVEELGWEQDCYELVPPDAAPGAVMPQEMYAKLLQDCMQYYDPSTTYTVRTPRGCNFYIQFSHKQMWKPLEPSDNAKAYVDSLLYNAHGDLIVLSARGRSRAANRNIPEHVWNATVDGLVQHGFIVALTGTKHSSFLVNKVGRNIINVIPRTGVDGLDILIALLKRAKFSITSQSGPTHVSLQCETPSYIIGHEARRHSVEENYLNAPAMFRPVPNGLYIAMHPETIIEDALVFDDKLTQVRNAIDTVYRSCYNDDKNIMHNLMYAQELDFYKVNVNTMRQELTNAA